ncbi:hypothetical protein [Nocardioides astragali]|uniref:Uncharacterized protein n=1 Tax=Nocardioides astragali TaxID=1776736 RepID=A0ABW2NAI7_9ACTN|nr:hypothetical protein [Nocardioides astragali]
MSSEVDKAASSDVTTEPAHRATVLFVRMWAIAHILHLLIAERNALNTPWNIAVVALAIAVLLRPEAGPLFAILLVAQVIEHTVEMPFSPDHWALVALVNLAILLTMLVGRSTSLETIAKAFPTARTLLLIAYAAAALSKWNTTFLDPVTSCANAIAGLVTFGLAGPLAESHVVNYGALATESLIFLLLVIPRTRTWGVLLGLAFHFSLSASPIIVVGDYTSTVYALFFLFLRPEVIGRVLDRTSSWAGRSAVVRDARRRPPVTAVLAFVVLGFGGHVLGPVPLATLYVLEQFYFVPVLLATALAVREQRADGSGRRLRLGRIQLLHVPVLLLALVWVLNPYLGLRTTGTNTMFSNLRTESPDPNHLFMPSWRVTDWQDDMVTLVSSTDPELQAGADNDLAVPLVALRRIAMDRPGLEVTGVLHGETVTFGSEKAQTELEPLPAWQYRLFLLRPVSTTDAPFCPQG